MRTFVLSLFLLALLSGATAPAFAGPGAPEILLAIGGTTAVQGDPNKGGFAVSGTAMWPIETSRLAFGVSLYADDMGTRLGQFHDAGTPSLLLGAYEVNHRYVYGGAWRLDVDLDHGSRWAPYATTSWGYARVQDDARGVISNAQSSAEISGGLGIRRQAFQVHTVGLAVRYHHLFDDRVSRYVSASLEWGWRFGGSR